MSTSLAAERMVIRYGEQRLEFEVKRSNQRPHAVRIHLDPMRGVWVIAPSAADGKAIRAAVRRRARWIYSHLGPSQGNSWKSRGISGEEVLYLGRRYMLKVVSGHSESACMKGGQILVTAKDQNASNITTLLDNWYRARAIQYFSKRLKVLYRPRLHPGIEPPRVSLRKMRRQWGSCSPKGHILLNPTLVRAPRECVDYVIAHELSHLAHHDHGDKFYSCLSKTLPDWRSGREKLDLLTHRII